ncbi:amino acid ABC transporter permease [Bifidobacterium parmae]|uniref:Amino acid ABC transporter permease n=1 Tax=Bifidobacterium parmae TaxID=361854 RepID=A0A2N5J598_9BIFI|nr:ABC transporter permease subunit [Bifidobacterium parmae]PLS29357.1 amino acid ABC transporter permease [Bifidobacterium parmae]
MIRPFSWQQVIDSLRAGAQFIPQTLILAIVPFLVALVVGMAIAMVRVWRVPVLSQIFQAYIVIFKGIPVYLLLIAGSLIYISYFDVVAQHFGWAVRQKDISMIWLGLFLLSIQSIPAVSEILRGAFLSVSDDQYEAGYAAGLSRWQVTRDLIIPQMIPEAMPGLANCFVSFVKASALCSLIGVTEVMSSAVRAANVSYDLVEAYIASAVIYWPLCAAIEFLMGRIERKVSGFKAVLAA